jgi:hypothetical protein
VIHISVKGPIMTAYQAGGGEDLLVHNWRVDRLTRLGVPGSLAEVRSLPRSATIREARSPISLRFTLAAIDGAFVARQADRRASLEQLPAARGLARRVPAGPAGTAG